MASITERISKLENEKHNTYNELDDMWECMDKVEKEAMDNYELLCDTRSNQRRLNKESENTTGQVIGAYFWLMVSTLWLIVLTLIVINT